MGVSGFYEVAFGKRPSVELYDLREDRHCMRNVSDDKAYADRRQRLDSQLRTVLVAEGDPRMVEDPCRFEEEPYSSLMKKYVTNEGQAFLKRLEEDRAMWKSRPARL